MKGRRTLTGAPGPTARQSQDDAHRRHARTQQLRARLARAMSRSLPSTEFVRAGERGGVLAKGTRVSYLRTPGSLPGAHLPRSRAPVGRGWSPTNGQTTVSCLAVVGGWRRADQVVPRRV